MVRRLPLLCPRIVLPGQARLEGARIIPPDPGSFKLPFNLAKQQSVDIRDFPRYQFCHELFTRSKFMVADRLTAAV
jgi:hypothetical protein